MSDENHPIIYLVRIYEDGRVGILDSCTRSFCNFEAFFTHPPTREDVLSQLRAEYANYQREAVAQVNPWPIPLGLKGQNSNQHLSRWRINIDLHEKGKHPLTGGVAIYEQAVHRNGQP